MKYVLFLVMILFSNQALALNCEKQPTCEALNYSKEDDPNCAEDGYILCPYDQSYKKCVDYDCETLGFTNSDKTSWCADLIECKGNKKMTLCQKPCLATDYNSLKELAGSSKCKVVTLRNDIEMPQNQGITLAANTIIDGGGHTLQSSGNKGFNIYNLNNNSGFKNILIKHEQSQTQENLKAFVILHDTYKATLHDTQILVQSDDKENHGCHLFHYGTYEISGKFTADIQPERHYTLSYARIVFKDADINVTTKGLSSDAFSAYTATFINSHGTVTTGGACVTYDRTLTLKNSKIHLQDNAELKLTFSTLTGGDIRDIDKLAHIKFESPASAPATLIVEGTGKLDSGDVTANNTANTVVLNGVTYHPKKATTTLLSEIPTSGDWEKVVQ